MYAVGCRCARWIFCQWQKVRCHCNGMLWAKYTCRVNCFMAKLLPRFLANSHWIHNEWFSYDVHVGQHDTFFGSDKKCVAMPMVTAYIWAKMMENLDFSQFPWNLAHMFDLGCRYERHIYTPAKWSLKEVYTCRNQRTGDSVRCNLASRTSASVFDRFPWNLAQMCALGC